VDRFEDVTDPNLVEKSKDAGQETSATRNIIFYGYVRGTHLKESTKIHVLGVGDFDITSVEKIPDPLPLPNPESSAERKVRYVCCEFNSPKHLFVEGDANHLLATWCRR
jgi:ribosome biogenesis protein BMS1